MLISLLKIIDGAAYIMSIAMSIIKIQCKGFMLDYFRKNQTGKKENELKWCLVSL